MEYEASDTNKKYKQASIGTHTGVCYMVVDIGTQKTSFEGEEKEVRQVIIGWELPDEKTDEGKPLSIFKTYTLSFNEKASLAIAYKAWMKEPDAKKFNLSKLIGSGCNLTIGRTSGDNAKVTGVSALKAKEKVPELTVGKIEFDLRAPDPLALDYLPKFIVEKIEASPEWAAYKNGEVPIAKEKPAKPDELDDSIPFSWAIGLGLTSLMLLQGSGIA